jgi:protein BCP1
MPVEVVPHMYRMLAEEMQSACDNGEPYHFGHLLVLSRTYTLSDEEAEATFTSSQQQKRRKGASLQSAAESVYTFHHEDRWFLEVRAMLCPRSVQPAGIEPCSKGCFSFI